MTATTSHLTQTALYSPLDKEYNQEMSGPYKDLGCAGLKDGRISGYWRPLVGINTEQLLHLWAVSQDIYYMDFLENGLSLVSSMLLSKGYKATPYYTQIIDLTKSESELKAGVRKSYRSLINKDHVTSDMHDIVPYKRLHEQVRGVTRHSDTWHIQQKMIWQKEAFCLIQARFKNMQNPLATNTIVEAGVLVYYNKDTAYYASGASTVDSHALMWQAILKAKKLGCKKFEMGEQVFGESKEANISKFKRGFGGITEVRLILEKERT